MQAAVQSARGGDKGLAHGLLLGCVTNSILHPIDFYLKKL